MPSNLLDRWIVHPVNYWGGFVVHLTTGAVLLALGLRSADAPAWVLAPSALAGWATWTLLEYLVHRGAFHGPFGPALRGHAIHHDLPKTTVGIPFFLPSLVAVVIWAGLRVVFGSDLVAGAWMAATLVSYTGYGLMHHAQHHVRFRSRWLRELQRHHLVHHAQPDRNFGVTTRFWDGVFGTLAPVERR